MSQLTLDLMARRHPTDALTAIAEMHRPLFVVGAPKALSSRCKECRRPWPCESHTLAHAPLQRGLKPEHRYCCQAVSQPSATDE